MVKNLKKNNYVKDFKCMKVFNFLYGRFCFYYDNIFERNEM